LDFLKGLKIYEDIINKTIKDTTLIQIKQLEEKRDVILTESNLDKIKEDKPGDVSANAAVASDAVASAVVANAAVASAVVASDANVTPATASVPATGPATGPVNATPEPANVPANMPANVPANVPANDNLPKTSIPAEIVKETILPIAIIKPTGLPSESVPGIPSFHKVLTSNNHSSVSYFFFAQGSF
jgi:hypothetical protein